MCIRDRFLTGDLHAGLVHRLERSGPRSGLLEVMVGPGGPRTLNPLPTLVEQVPTEAETYFPSDQFIFRSDVIGTHTVESMQSGIVYGYVGLVDGIVERLITELGTDDVHVIAIGGLAGLISQDTSRIDRVEPFLTLEGLRLIAERIDMSSSTQEA